MTFSSKKFIIHYRYSPFKARGNVGTSLLPHHAELRLSFVLVHMCNHHISQGLESGVNPLLSGATFEEGLLRVRAFGARLRRGHWVGDCGDNRLRLASKLDVRAVEYAHGCGAQLRGTRAAYHHILELVLSRSEITTVVATVTSQK